MFTDDITIANRYILFLNDLKETDVLQAQYGFIDQSRPLFQGLFINGRAIDTVYYSRKNAKWTNPNLEFLD